MIPLLAPLIGHGMRIHVCICSCLPYYGKPCHPLSVRAQGLVARRVVADLALTFGFCFQNRRPTLEYTLYIIHAPVSLCQCLVPSCFHVPRTFHLRLDLFHSNVNCECANGFVSCALHGGVKRGKCTVLPGVQTGRRRESRRP